MAVMIDEADRLDQLMQHDSERQSPHFQALDLYETLQVESEKPYAGPENDEQLDATEQKWGETIIFGTGKYAEIESLMNSAQFAAPSEREDQKEEQFERVDAFDVGDDLVK